VSDKCEPVSKFPGEARSTPQADATRQAWLSGSS
jgi:hypothetical protein